MKDKLFPLAVAVGVAALLVTGCAHMGESSRAMHTMQHYAVAVPPGWNVSTVQLSNCAAGNVFVTVNFSAPGTNRGGFWSNLTSPRPHIYQDWRETWADHVSGGGTFVLTDPTASALSFSHTNQSALGGSRMTTVGQIQSAVTTNDVAVISATGTAIGNVVGAAISASTGGATATVGTATATAASAVTNKVSTK